MKTKNIWLIEERGWGGHKDWRIDIGEQIFENFREAQQVVRELNRSFDDEPEPWFRLVKFVRKEKP